MDAMELENLQQDMRSTSRRKLRLIHQRDQLLQLQRELKAKVESFDRVAGVSKVVLDGDKSGESVAASVDRDNNEMNNTLTKFISELHTLKVSETPKRNSWLSFPIE